MEKNVFDQPVKIDIRAYENNRKIGTGQGYDYTNSCLLDYTYFKENYELTAIDISKEQTLDPDQIAIQKTNFPGNLE